MCNRMKEGVLVCLKAVCSMLLTQSRHPGLRVLGVKVGLNLSWWCKSVFGQKFNGRLCNTFTDLVFFREFAVCAS